jgi:hypothetical protein
MGEKSGEEEKRTHAQRTRTQAVQERLEAQLAVPPRSVAFSLTSSYAPSLPPPPELVRIVPLFLLICVVLTVPALFNVLIRLCLLFSLFVRSSLDDMNLRESKFARSRVEFASRTVFEADGLIFRSGRATGGGVGVARSAGDGKG